MQCNFNMSTDAQKTHAGRTRAQCTPLTRVLTLSTGPRFGFRSKAAKLYSYSRYIIFIVINNACTIYLLYCIM